MPFRVEGGTEEPSERVAGEPHGRETEEHLPKRLVEYGDQRAFGAGGGATAARRRLEREDADQEIDDALCQIAGPCQVLQGALLRGDPSSWENAGGRAVARRTGQTRARGRTSIASHTTTSTTTAGATS